MTFLLDADVLIAVTVEEHEHHERTSRWMASVDLVAVCPLVQGALVRSLLRMGESAATAAEVLQSLAGPSSVAFRADSVSYADLDLSPVVGHRQVTDVYLVGLRSRRGTGASR